jgi:hypothetical protein
LTIPASYFGYQCGNITGTAITINTRVRGVLKHIGTWTRISDLLSNMLSGATVQTVQSVTYFIKAFFTLKLL